MILQATGELSSGYSNLWKARYLVDHERRWAASGNVENPDKTPITSAILQAFGFRDYDEALKYYVGDVAYQKSNDYREDVKQQVADSERFAVRLGLDKGDDEWYAQVSGALTRGMGNNPQRLADTHNLITQKMAAGNDRIFKSLLGVLYQNPPSEMRNIINNLPDDGTYQKQMLLNLLDEIDKQEL